MATLKKTKASAAPAAAAETTLTLEPSGSEIEVTIGTPVDVTVTTNATDFSVESGTTDNATVAKGQGKFTITGVKAGDSVITVKATAADASEKSVQITAKVKEAPVKPAAPVETNAGAKEVNEGQELTIAFNNVEGGTLAATVEGGDGNGTVQIEGFNVKYTAPTVDADKDVVIRVTVSKDSLTSDPTDVSVKVKNVPEKTRLLVNPNSLQFTEGQQSTAVTVDTDADDYSVSIDPSDVATYDKGSKTFTGKKQGTATATFTATASNKTEATAQVSLIVEAAQVQKPAKPTISGTGIVNVNENESVEIRFGVEADATLEATVENQQGQAVYKAGSTNTEGIITYTAPADVESDTAVKLTVVAKKNNLTSDPLEVTVNVKNVAAKPVTTLEVTPAEIEVPQTETGYFNVVTNAAEFTVVNKNRAIYTATRKGNQVEVVALRPGAAYLDVEAQVEGGDKVTKTVVVSVIDQSIPPTILNITPAGPLTLKEGAEQIFDIETNTHMGVTMVSDKPEIVSADIRTKKATALKPGKANITFSAKNGAAATKQVVVEITVTESIPEVPEEEPKLTDEEVKTEITKPDFNYKEDIPELGKKLPLKYVSELSVVKSYVNHMSMNSNILSSHSWGRQSFNMYYVITDILEDTVADETKFTNILTLLSKMFFEYREEATSRKFLGRGVEHWAKLDISSKPKDEYTYLTLFGMIADLADEDNRDTNKAKINFDEEFAEDKVNLSPELIAALKKFYQF